MKITTAEALIMDVLWRADRPLAAEELREALADKAWNDRTVRTLLSRLAAKKAVAQTKDGKRFLYSPLTERGEYLHAESKGVIDRLFGGRIGPFVAHFSSRQDLSEDEIAELRALLERLSRDR